MRDTCLACWDARRDRMYVVIRAIGSLRNVVVLAVDVRVAYVGYDKDVLQSRAWLGLDFTTLPPTRSTG